MLIRFSTKTGPDISMFERDALQMLKLMGRSGKIPGAIKDEDVDSALEKLQSALKAQSADHAEEKGDEEKGIGLSTRAWPLMEMLRRAIKNDETVMWEHDDKLV